MSRFRPSVRTARSDRRARRDGVQRRSMKRSMSSSKARFSAAERELTAWIATDQIGCHSPSGLHDAEQVVEPVVGAKGSPSMSKNRSPGDGGGQRGRPRSGSSRLDRRRIEELVERPPAASPSTWMRACSRTRSSAARLEPSRGGSSGSSSTASSRRVRHARASSARRWRRLMPATRRDGRRPAGALARRARQRQTSQCSTGSG